MAKVTIIKVDLGVSIDDLISEDVLEMTSEAKQQLDTIIAVAKDSRELRTKQLTAKQLQEQHISTIMDDIHDRLEAAGPTGIPVAEVMSMVSPHIVSPSALTMRLKTRLRRDGNKYALGKQQVDNKPCYIFEPYNLDDRPETEDAA